MNKENEESNERKNRFVERETLANVLQERQSQREGCLSLPFTVAFFAFYVMALLNHENVPVLFGVESSVKAFLVDYSFDADNSKTLYDTVEWVDTWKWFKEAFFNMLFQQDDPV